MNDAHAFGLAVFLDVIYDHRGPEGNYLSVFSPYYFSDAHTNPWGKGLNFDGRNSSMVRQFFIENALHWVHEYHMDGLRLDALPAIVDEDPRHFVAQLTARDWHSSTSIRFLHSWAATTPFLYFTDHPEELGKLVTEGAATSFATSPAFRTLQHANAFRIRRTRPLFRQPARLVRDDRRTARVDVASVPATAGAPATRCGDSPRRVRGFVAFIQMQSPSDLRIGDDDCLKGLNVSLWQLVFTTETTLPSRAVDRRRCRFAWHAEFDGRHRVG